MPESRLFGVLFVFTNSFNYLEDMILFVKTGKVKMEIFAINLEISIMGMLHGVNSF